MKTRLLAIVSLLACACTANVNQDLGQYDVTGPVREISVQSDTVGLPWTAEFNRLGQLEKVVVRNMDGSDNSVRTYHYNCRKQLTRVDGIATEDNEILTYKYKFDGRFIKECHAYNSENEEVYSWIQENDGEHVVRYDYYHNGELQYYVVKEFDGDSYKSFCHYANGDLMSMAEVDFFQVEEKPTRIVAKDADAIIERDENGLPVMSRGTVLNSVGALSELDDPEAYPCRYYSYEFDDHGNWITRYERKEPDSPEAIVLKRTIIYY